MFLIILLPFPHHPILSWIGKSAIVKGCTFNKSHICFVHMLLKTYTHIKVT